MAFQTHFTYYGPTRLYLGRGAIANISNIASERQVKKALVVTDKGLIAAGLVKRITDLLGIPHAIYADVAPNPPIRNVVDCTECYKAEGCDHLIAIGGGSSMDVAKTAGVLIANGGKIADYFIGTGGPVKKRIPCLL